MISIKPLALELLDPFKAARLTALQDTPTAFGSTYAKESQLSNEDWLRRATSWNSGRSACFIAMDENIPCGIVACKWDEPDANGPGKAHLLSMWVAPDYRRTGVGARLVSAVEQWAGAAGVRDLHLMVTSRNFAAMRFYERCGFAFTGKTEPYPNDPALFEREMAKSLRESTVEK